MAKASAATKSAPARRNIVDDKPAKAEPKKAEPKKAEPKKAAPVASKKAEPVSRADTKLAVTFSPEDLAFLRKRADKEGISASALIRDIVSKAVQRMKASAAGQETKRRTI